MKSGKTQNRGQFGEVNLILKQFKKIGVRNKWCFEVGAHNGIQNSNTYYLIKKGWRAVLIEGNLKLFQQLKKNYASNRNVIPVNTYIKAQSLDDILSYYHIPKNIDLGVIDIDGQDFWVLAGLQEYKPRLLLVEFSPYVDKNFLPELDSTEELPKGMNQAGYKRVLDLARAKGYSLIASTYCNLLLLSNKHQY